MRQNNAACRVTKESPKSYILKPVQAFRPFRILIEQNHAYDTKRKEYQNMVTKVTKTREWTIKNWPRLNSNEGSNEQGDEIETHGHDWSKMRWRLKIELNKAMNRYHRDKLVNVAMRDSGGTLTTTIIDKTPTERISFRNMVFISAVQF